MYPLMACICFANEDRDSVAEPLVYRLRNYGLEIWYDRSKLVMGDNRREKNLDQGISDCKYAVVIASPNTWQAEFALEEMALIHERAKCGVMVPLPILYELSPDELPGQLEWVKQYVFKEVSQESGLFDATIHIICRITSDICVNTKYSSVSDLAQSYKKSDDDLLGHLLASYTAIDNRNLNSKITMLYALFQIVATSGDLDQNVATRLARTVFRRFFEETKLNLPADYRQIWILENCLCIAFSHYQDGRDESST